MTSSDRLGGIIHAYQKYDPFEFPSPTARPLVTRRYAEGRRRRVN